MNQIQYPNKIFIVDHKRSNTMFERKVKTVVVIAASDQTTAEKYLYEKFNIKVELVWLMNAGYPTIYDQRGNVQPIQAKILYTTSAILEEK